MGRSIVPHAAPAHAHDMTTHDPHHQGAAHIHLQPGTARAVLEALARTSPEYGPGLTDHAAMAVEALERIAPAAIEPFASRYLPRLRSLDRKPDAALAGFGALAASCAERLTQDGAARSLAAKAPALGRSVAGAAFHGILRVAHAARGLERDDHPVRRAELGRALAYATIRADVLPGRPEGASGGSLSLGDALAQLAPSPEALVHRPGMITPTLVARAAAHPALAAVSAALRRDGEPVARALELRREATRLLARGEHAPAVTFTLLHAVTGSEAVLTLAKRLPREQAHLLVSEGAHALLAMRVAFVGALERPSTGAAAAWPALVARAVASLDDHAIKLAAALDDPEGLEDDARRAALEAWLTRLHA